MFDLQEPSVRRASCRQIALPLGIAATGGGKALGLALGDFIEDTNAIQPIEAAIQSETGAAVLVH